MRTIKPIDGTERHSELHHALDRVETQVNDGRRVMSWIFEKSDCDAAHPGQSMVRTYSWNPETRQYDFDADDVHGTATRERIESFLNNLGPQMLNPADYEYLKSHMGIGEVANDVVNEVRTAESAR